MKTCVVTASYACDPQKVWLYLTNPTLNGWRKDVKSYEENDGGMQVVEYNTDGEKTELHFTRREKPRCLSCTFQKGKIQGTFTAILLGGGNSTSLECTMEVQGMGLFANPKKMLEARLQMLQAALGV